jgi:hypothetical protein
MKQITMQDLQTMSLTDLDRIARAAKLAYTANPFYGMKVILTAEDVYTAANSDDSETTSPLQWKIAIANIIKEMSIQDLGFNFDLQDVKRGKYV